MQSHLCDRSVSLSLEFSSLLKRCKDGFADDVVDVLKRPVHAPKQHHLNADGLSRGNNLVVVVVEDTKIHKTIAFPKR